MGYIDMHCDTLMKVWESGDSNLLTNPFSIDLHKLKAGGASAQFFAMFLLPEDYLASLSASKKVDDETYLSSLRNILLHAIEIHSDKIDLALSNQDVQKNKADKKISAFLTIEDGRSVQGSLENIQRYHQMGVRLLTLLWNHENCFGFPNSFNQKEMKRGLKPFGIEAISYMQEIGMMVDVSHLSDGGFYDVAKYAAKPFLASHSNCRALSPHPRNLTDDMIKILSNAGGIAGLNFAPAFLNSDIKNRKSTIEDMVHHVTHLLNVGGEECLALGTDFDGISGDFEVKDASFLPSLFEKLKKSGLTERQMDKFLFKNAERIIFDTL